MSSSNNYGVKLGMSFVSFDTVNKEYQTILKRLSKSGQINVNARLEKSDLENMIKDFKQVVNQKVTFDTTGAKTEIQVLRNSANELLTIINKFKADGTTSSSISGSSKAQLEAQKGIYKELNRLQTAEFNLKKQMITAEGSHYNELNRQLGITKQLQSSTGKALNSNGLTSEKETNNLMLKRLELQNKLNAKGSQVNEAGIVKLSKNIDGFANKISALKSKYKGLVPDAELSKFDALLNNLRARLESMKKGEVIDGRKLTSEIDNVKSAYDKLNLSTKNSSMAFKTGNQDVRSFGSALVDTASKMGIYLSSAIAFRKIFQEFKEAIEYTKTMDKGMTNIQMITGQTASQAKETVSQFKELGAELHVTNTEIIASSEELLRAGYSAEEAKKMMSASLIGSKVSGQTAEVVSEQLIAMKNAFGLSADSMEHYIDVISKLDNTSATSFAEIADAVQRTAFSAQQAGTPLETLMTYITTVSEKTRKSAETIGESFKTIYSRYSNIKLGNLDEDGKSINDTERAMARVGIQIRDSKDSFREFDDVLQEFMTKYKSGQLSQVDYLAGIQALSGSRQRETLMALSENMDALNKHQEDVASSAGSARAMLESAYDGSIDAKINGMKRSFESLYETLLNSKTVGTGFDVISSGVQGISKAFGSLPTVIGLVVAGFTIFNTKLRESSTLYSNMLSPINTINTKLASMSTSLKATALGYSKSLTQLKSYTVAMQGAGMSTSGYATKLALLNTNLVVAKAGMVALKVATIATQVAMSVGLSLVITGVISLVTKLNKSTEEMIKNNKEMVDGLNAQKDSIISSRKLLLEKESLEKQINLTNEGTAENLSLKEKLLEVEKQLAKALPNTTTGFSAQGEAISESSEAVLAEIKVKENKQREELKKELEGFKGIRFEGGAEFGMFEVRGVNSLDTQRKKLEENIRQMEMALKRGEKISKLVKKINEDGSFEYYSQDDVTLNNELYLGAEENRLTTLREKLDELNSSNDTVKYLVLQLKELGVEDDVIIQKLKISSETFSMLTKKIEDTTKKTKDFAKEWTSLRKYGDTIDVEESQKSYAGSIESIKQLTGWIASMNSESGYTSDIMLEILKIYPEMSTYISDTVRVQDELNKKIVEQEETQKRVYLELMSKDTEFYNSKIKGTENWEGIVAKSFELVGEISDAYYSDNITNMKNDLSNANDLAKARATLETNLIQALAQAWGKYYSTLASLTQNNIKAYDSYGQLNTNTNPMTEEDYGNMGGMEAFGKSLEQMNSERTANNKTITDMSKGLADSYSAYAKGMKELENIGVNIDFLIPTPNLGGGGDSTSGKDAVDHTVKSLESLRDAYQRLNTIIEETQHQLNILDKREQISYGYDKLDLMKKKIQFLEREQSLTNQLANTYRAEAQAQRNDLSSKGVQFDSEGLISNYNEILGAMRNSANSMSSYDDSSKKAKENAIENVKQLKESMESYSNTTIKGLRSAEVSWEELTNTIRDQYKEIVQLTATAEDKVSSIIQKEIEKRYNKRKEALDKQRKLYEDSYKNEDYEDDKAELEDKIQAINQDLISAMKTQNQSAVKELQEQKAEAIKELNSLVTDKERENASDVFDKALEDIDSQKEDMLEAENLTKMVTQAMQSGFINVNGEIINLSDSMDIFLKESVIGTANLRLQMDDLVTSIANGIAGLKDLGSYSAFLNSSNLVGDVLSKNVLSVTSNILPIKSNDSKVIYQAGDININGSVTEEVFPKLKAEMQNIADGAVNKFVKYVNGQ